MFGRAGTQPGGRGAEEATGLGDEDLYVDLTDNSPDLIPNDGEPEPRGNTMFLFNPRRSKVLDNNLLLHYLQKTKSALILAQSQRQFVKYRKDTN